MIEGEDASCDVCKSNEVESEDKIIFCDNCDVAVHQGCYGVARIPSGSWFCKTCENEIQPTCLFCLQDKGAMKNTVDGRWAHVSCTLWIPEVNFANPETMDNIQYLEKIPKSRWALSCVVCRKKGGACIQCYVPSCKTAYHVSCGFKNGFHMKMEDVVTSESEIIFESFCRKHTAKMSSFGKPKQQKKSNDDENVAQFCPNSVSIDATTKEHRDSQFRSYLEGLKAGMKSNLQHNIAEVSVLREGFENKLEQSPNGTYKNASGPENINTTNGNDDKVVEDKSSNSPNENDNENEEHTVEKVTEQTVTHNENQNQLLENEIEDLNDVPNRAYIGTFLVAKATARKSCAVPNQVQATTPNKVQGTTPKKLQGTTANSKVTKKRELKNILPKIAKPRKAPNKPKVAKPKNPPKRKASQSPATKDSKTAPAKSPKVEEPVTPQNMLSQNCDQKLSVVGKPVAMSNNHPPYFSPPRSSSQWSTSMEVASMIQNHHPSSTDICVPMSSNSRNLNPFLGYLASLLQSLPEKKSLKVQRKIITEVLKEHNLSSSSDDISDVSSMSD